MSIEHLHFALLLHCDTFPVPFDCEPAHHFWFSRVRIKRSSCCARSLFVNHSPKIRKKLNFNYISIPFWYWKRRDQTDKMQKQSQTSTFHTPSGAFKAPSRKSKRRSFTPMHLNIALTPKFTPIDKSGSLEVSRDYLDASLTPSNTSMCNLFFGSANRNNDVTPQSSIVLKREVNKTFTIRRNKSEKP